MGKTQIKNQNYFVLFFLAAFFLFAFYPVLKSLFAFWSRSDEYSHGFFIIPATLYVCWQKKQSLANISVKHSWIGFAGLIFSLIVYIGSRYAGITTIISVSMILCLASLILFLYGWAMLRELSFPLFFLFFMIPVPGQIYASLTTPLQFIVSKFSVLCTSLLGIPILREGNLIHLPGKTLEVVQACSGLRSLMSLLTLSLLMGYFSLRKNIFRVMLFISAVPIAIFVNIIRISITIVALYYFQYDLTDDSVHTTYGIIIFGLALAVIFGFQKVMKLWDTPINLK